MTKNRKIILELINASRTHPTAEDIWEMSRELVPGISLATVYNNLNALCEENFIRRISADNTPKSAVHFDRNDPHEHMVCDRCHRITDISLNGFMNKVCDVAGVQITSYDLILHHVCPNCNNA